MQRKLTLLNSDMNCHICPHPSPQGEGLARASPHFVRREIHTYIQQLQKVVNSSTHCCDSQFYRCFC